jgi:uncharacterized protein
MGPPDKITNGPDMEKNLLADWENAFAGYLRGLGEGPDGAHDLGHVQRVWKTAQLISREEGESQAGGIVQEGAGADLLIVLAAAYFHDLVALPKDHPRRREASRLCAEKTGLLLEQIFPDFPADKIAGVRHAIHAHSFSAGIRPETLEARILQDADRLEALGAIGLARVFYTAGQLNARLFDAEDPLGRERPLDDRLFALDHFQMKLLKLPSLMNTPTGRKLAEKRAAYLADFLGKICDEIEGGH